MRAIPTTASFAACILLCVANASETTPETVADASETRRAPAARTDLKPAELVTAFRERYLAEAPVTPAHVHADGALSRELGTHEQHYSVVRIGPDGEVEVACLPPETAANFLEQAVATADRGGADE